MGCGDSRVLEKDKHSREYLYRQEGTNDCRNIQK